MDQKTVDWKIVEACGVYLQLMKESKLLQEKLDENKEKMELIRREVPQIGNLVGLVTLKSEKKKKKEKKTPKEGLETADSSEKSSKMETGEKEQEKTKKRKKTDAEKKIEELEKEKKKKRPNPRTSAVEQGGLEFHSTNRSAPPMLEKEGASISSADLLFSEKQ